MNYINYSQKNITSKLFSLFLISASIFLFGLIALIPENVQAASLSPSEFSVGDIVSISGYGFGPSKGMYGNVCFNSMDYCLIDSSIKSWSDSKIEFIVPTGISTMGDIIIYSESKTKKCIEYVYIDDYCYIDYKQNKVAILPYAFKPVIGRIDLLDRSIGEGFTLTNAKAGDIVYIQGVNFGSKRGRGSVSLSGGDSAQGAIYSAKIISWSDNEIKVEIPETNYATNKIYVTIDPPNSTNTLISSSPFDFKIIVQISQDQYSGYQDYLTRIGIERSWGYFTEKDEVIVAIIDGGIKISHPDLVGKIWFNNGEIFGDNIDNDQNGYIDDKVGWNFVKNNYNTWDANDNHSTVIAGIIGAIKNNNIGITGISNKAKIMPIVACGVNGCEWGAISKAIYYAADNGARVINISLGGNYNLQFEKQLDKAISYAYNKGIVILVAAGNESIDTGINKISPVCNGITTDMVIGVGSLEVDNNSRSSFSNFGKCVDIYTIGENIVSTTANSDSDFYYAGDKTGTSFATPIISGMVAAIISAYPNISNAALNKHLLLSSRNKIFNAKDFVLEITKNYRPNNDQGKKWIGDEKKSIVNNESSYDTAINYLKEKNIVSGYSDGSFRPANPINRAEFIKIIIGATGKQEAGYQCFSDVKAEWFAPYICTAKREGIIGGYPDNTFRPNNNINVVEALKITFKAFNIQIRSPRSNENWYNPFTEYAKNNSYYLDTFDTPSKQIARGEMAELIYKVMQGNK